VLRKNKNPTGQRPGVFLSVGLGYPCPPQSGGGSNPVQPMKKVTLDTNILISGTFWTGSSFKILDMIDKKMVESVSSKDILSEYDKIIKSEEIAEKIENRNLMMSKISQNVISNSRLVEPKEKLDIVKDDPNDNIILECANEGKVDFLITNDKHLLKIKEFEGIKIVTPEEFLNGL